MTTNSKSSSNVPARKQRAKRASAIVAQTATEQITNEYNRRLRAADALAEEVVFTLRKAIGDLGLKVHEISSRVKELDSVIRKIRDKEYDGIDRVRDLIGGRVVCLFRSDLERISDVVTDQFQVDDFDDKLIDDPNSFGYMSLHYQCRLRQDLSGPRYDYLKEITFELQIRTIGMHAWSVVQHYLEYKGAWDVPKSLKKDINALSALFYVADSQFEAVYAAKVQSSDEAGENIASNKMSDEAINLDSLEAYIRTKFPDRPQTTSSRISELVEELKKSGYVNLDEVARDIDRAENAFLEYEGKRQEGRYFALGAMRISLAIASEKYRNYKKYSPGMFASVQKFVSAD